MGVLEGGYFEPARYEPRDHLGEERGLARAAPARESDDTHGSTIAANAHLGRIATPPPTLAVEGLLRRLHLSCRRWRGDTPLGGLLLDPQAVMLLRPIGVDGAV